MATEVEKKETSKPSAARRNEIVAIVLSAVAVLLFLCLISYNPADWSLNSTGGLGKTNNWIGVFGSIVSDILFQSIGNTALLLPFLLALIAWRYFRAVLHSSVSLAVGFLLFIASVSGLLTIFGFPPLFSRAFEPGGLAGEVIVSNVSYLFGKIGTIILLLALFLTSILLFTSLSYLTFFDIFRANFDKLKVYFDENFRRFRAWREEQTAAALARKEKRREIWLEKGNSVRQHREPPISRGGAVLVDENSTPAKGKSVSVGARASAVLSRLKSITAPKVKEARVMEQTAEPEMAEGLGNVSLARDKSAETIKSKISKTNGGVKVSSPEESSGETKSIPVTSAKEVNESVEIAQGKKKETIVQTNTGDAQNFNGYVLPTTDFLESPPPRIKQKDDMLLAVAQELTEKSSEFNVNGSVMKINQGPVVTTYEFKPDPGVKYSRVTGLADDLCLALKAESIRIDRIPGKAYVGIEVPNPDRETIFLREVIESTEFRESKSLLTVALGKTINGSKYIADLGKMPHLLIAGATGAGKSVGVNTLIVSILYKAQPDEVKFIMVDPKRLELGLYADIPHLATPIITDPKRAAISLKWAVSEMEKRYKDLAGWGVRNIDGYNTEVKKRNANEYFDDNGEPWKPLPYIVIIIDELADLMMVSGKEVEESITRLAQMARAVGIHLVLATQRPSVDVITGLIKANFPARISFRVSSKVDSRTIIDANGSERLLGKGDMLFLPPATSQIIRVHGAFVDEREIARIVEHIKAQGKPEYDTTITKTEEEMDDSGDLPGKKDPLFMDALKSVVNAKRASTSLLQRHLRIGYGRAAAILDAMVREGYIGEMDGSTRARPILEKAYEALSEADENDSF